MTDIPILFSASMVTALLDGRKRQTRRIIKPQPERQENGLYHVFNRGGGFIGVPEQNVRTTAVDYVRWQIGDRLWVRETWQEVGSSDPGLIVTRADYPACVPRDYENVPAVSEIKWRPGIHMPRRASRLTLIVTNVRVQRLQDITEEDASAEGVKPLISGNGPDGPIKTHRTGFVRIWGTLNGNESWLANPWVAAISFSVERANVDHASELTRAA